MKPLKKKAVTLVFWLGTLFLSAGLQAQPVFDLPTTDFNPSSDPQSLSIPMTLQVGDIETGIINPVTGEPLNDVALVFNPNDDTLPTDIRFYTIYHTSSADTRALTLSAPADLTYPADADHIAFDTPSSVMILDLNRDGQNDLAFNGALGTGSPSPWDEGPSPILGVMGTGSDPFVGGNVDMLDTTISIYNFPLFIGLEPYGGQPSLAAGKLGGDAFTDLAINDWRVPDNITASNPIDGTGNTGFGQMLRTLFNNGTIGPLPSVATLIAIPDPAFDLLNAVPMYIVVADFDMDGADDAAVVYVIQTDENSNYEIRLMVYPGNGDGTFNVHPTISEGLADLGDFRETNGGPTSLTYGDFDGNGHLDFAVSYNLDANAPFGLNGFTAVITCAPGTPPACSVQQLAFTSPLIVIHIDAGDFDGDGLDDLVQSEETCNTQQCIDSTRGQVSAYLNQSGSFSTTPDQTITPELPSGSTTSIYWQVIARDIDGCSPEDIAFTGELTDLGTTGPSPFTNQAIVAFATVEDPIADAGFGTPVDGGIQLGGDPTCFDPNGNPTQVLWTQISGDPATISDPTASNPIVTDIGFNEDSVFQVTCSNACRQAQATITVGQTLCISGSGHFWSTIRTGCAGCSLNRNDSSSRPASIVWLLGLLFGMGWLRLRSPFVNKD